jgi:hypothetical protein
MKNISHNNLVHRDEEKMVDARKEFYENADVNEKWERRGQFKGKIPF